MEEQLRTAQRPLSYVGFDKGCLVRQSGTSGKFSLSAMNGLVYRTLTTNDANEGRGRQGNLASFAHGILMQNAYLISCGIWNV